MRSVPPEASRRGYADFKVLADYSSVRQEILLVSPCYGQIRPNRAVANRHGRREAAQNRRAQIAVHVKDSKRFADSGGWGYAVFDYDPLSMRSSPAP
ncbi:MAG: cytochrome P460 family protein [Bryobacteraceae bacterium]